MPNVIDAMQRFAGQRGLMPPRAPAEPFISRVRGIKVPTSDRIILATRAGEIAARLNPNNPMEGAKRLFGCADWEDKWQKRKRLVRLPGEEPSPSEQYGAYEASGSTWAHLALAAARLLSPYAEGQGLLREQERIFRNMLLGTSLLPQEFAPPEQATRSVDLIAELASAVAKRIERETKLQDLWEILRVSPFTLCRNDDGDGTVPHGKELANLPNGLGRSWREGWNFSNNTDGTINYGDWSFPKVRVGVLRRRLAATILVPPPHLADALLAPDDGDWLNPGSGPHEQRIIEWLSDNRAPGEFDPDKGFGWASMPIETTRSVYLEACPRDDGEIGLWLKVNEPLIDNFIPVLPGVDLVDLAYRHEFGRRMFGDEPFQFEAGWTSDIMFRELGILEWPSWCREYIQDDKVWRHGIIGVRDTDELVGHDHADQERFSPWTAEPPNWFGPQARQEEHYKDEADSFAPDGVGGWLDDTANRELKTALFMNTPDCTFHSLIAQEAGGDVPCRPGTIAESLLRNLDCTTGRIDQIMIEQARLLVDSGMRFHQIRVDHYRSKIGKLFE